MKRYGDAALAWTMRIDGRENLMRIRRAAAGIESVARILDLCATGEVSEDGFSVDGYIRGGLVNAIEELSCVIQSKTTEIFEWMGMDPCGRELSDEELGAESQQLGGERIANVAEVEPGRAADER